MNENNKNNFEKKDKYSFDDFIKIMKTLISEDGCPWDKVQTHETLKRYLIEESYEVIDAIDNNDKENLCEELGDVLLQVVFHSILAEKDSEFSLNDVIDGVAKKMIYRHPHIFSDVSAETADDVLTNWEELKKKEKGYNSKSDVLKSVPKSLPSLMRAEKVIKKADDSISEKDKLTETINELKNFVSGLDTNNLINSDDKEKTIGDLLFLVTKISAGLKINTEFALTNSTETFINKF